MDSSATTSELEKSARESDYDSQFNDSQLRFSNPLSPQPRDSFDTITDEEDGDTGAAAAAHLSGTTGRRTPIEVIPLTDAPDEPVAVVTPLTTTDIHVQNVPYDPEANHRRFAIAWLIILGATTSVFCFPAGIVGLIFAVLAWRWETSKRLIEREKYELRMHKVQLYRMVSLISSMVAVGIGVVVACVFISMGLVWSDQQQRPW